MSLINNIFSEKLTDSLVLCFLLLIFSTDISANRFEGNEGNEGKTTTNSYKKYTKPIKSKFRLKSGFHLIKRTNFKIEGVCTNNDKFYKKIKLIDVNTGKVVWSLKKKKLNFWGPVYRFSDSVKLKKGIFEIDIIDKNNSFSIIFTNKIDDEQLSSFYLKAGENNLADKMIDIFIEGKSSENYSNLILEKQKKELDEIKRAKEKVLIKYKEEKLLNREIEADEKIKYLRENEEKLSAEMEAKKKYEWVLKEKGKLNKEREVQKKQLKELIIIEEKMRAKELGLIKKEKKLDIDKQIKMELEKRSKVESELLDRENELKEKELIEIEKGKMEIENEKLKIEKDELEKQEKLLERFQIKIKKELIKDKLIKEDDIFKFELSLKKGFYLNDKKINKKFYNKYKKIYESHFKQKLSDIQKLILNGEYN